MRDTFVKTIIEIASRDKNVILITGDLGFGVLKPYWELLPGQFINAGIAEQNMMGLAAGMALEGKTVFVYSIGNFPTLRCLEQIRNDCAYHEANVKIVCVGGGFVYGALGMSHHATEDLAVIRALPGVTVMAPGDPAEAEAATRAIAYQPGTCYLRLGRGGEKRFNQRIENFQIGKAFKIRQGHRVAILSCGGILDEADAACDILSACGIKPSLYSFPTLKPIDRQTIQACALEYDLVVTIEEHSILGGLGGAVAEIMAEIRGNRAILLRVGLNDTYSSIVGSQAYLREVYGMDASAIAKRVIELLNA